MPLSAEDSQEITCLAEDILVRGVIQPILVVHGEKKGTYWAVDGRHRLAAAVNAGLTTIPAIVRNEEETLGIIVSSLVHRKHFTKGALAYISVPFLIPAAEASKARKQANTLVGTKPQDSEEPTKPFLLTLEDECLKLGFSIDLYQQSIRLREIFSESAEYKAQVEPKILAGEVGLGAAIAGYAGRTATKKKDKPAVNYLDINAVGVAVGLMPKALTTIRNGFIAWPKLNLEARAALKKEWDKLQAVIPADLLS